jgi:O-acetyl-ADP-ribose deacetylase (regulator of RNase III)
MYFYYKTYIYMLPQIIFFDFKEDFIEQYKFILENKIPNCAFLHESLDSLLQKNKDINAIVSPANSYGIMNGGIDRNINDILNNVEPLVKQKIEQVGMIDRSGRSYLPIGKCIVIPRNNYFLFVAPTMIMPSKLPNDTLNVSLAFMSILEQAFTMSKQGINLKIACPCLGTGVGQMSPVDSAKQILGAYNYFCKKYSK